MAHTALGDCMRLVAVVRTLQDSVADTFVEAEIEAEVVVRTQIAVAEQRRAPADIAGEEPVALDMRASASGEVH